MSNKPYSFSSISLERLNTCHIELQRLMHAVMNLQEIDFSILCGFRDKHDQDEAVREGHSMLCWPHGRHNHEPSLAVDIAAYPIDDFNKDNTSRTIMLAKSVLGVATKLEIPVFWGGHWTHFQDIYHFQLPESYAKPEQAKTKSRSGFGVDKLVTKTTTQVVDVDRPGGSKGLFYGGVRTTW